ncbi:hypothetical protein [Guptibacillus hwajinpoensis]|uniref:hypothetical protein n=1 Tax=Guptibacillus hwajinpoensis TaxID=208199 RepID=UPI003CFD6206
MEEMKVSNSVKSNSCAAKLYCGKERHIEARLKHVAGEIGACAFLKKKENRVFCRMKQGNKLEEHIPFS